MWSNRGIHGRCELRKKCYYEEYTRGGSYAIFAVTESFSVVSLSWMADFLLASLRIIKVERGFGCGSRNEVHESKPRYIVSVPSVATTM